MKEEKRYVVTVDMYVYGEDDYTARKNVHKMLDKINRAINKRHSKT